MAELTTFGIEQDFEFTGHLSLATHLVPMPKKTFATSDDTQIRVWGRSGDIAKMTYPKNKRSMVSAMTFCASHSLLLTAEIDMSFKAYSVATLDLLDTFKAEQKIAALAFYGPKDWLIAGGETGLEVWKLVKSPKRRIVVIGRYEHHFQLEFFRKLDTSGNILGINSEPSEERLIVWSSSALYIFDTGLTLLVACNKPHSEPIKCVAIQILSIIDTAVITGGQDCLVKFWNISNKQVNQSKSDSLDDEDRDIANRSTKGSSDASLASMRLEHSFKGHSRPVLMVCFYKRLERDKPQKLCVSCGLDDKMKVWSLDAFSLVYTLDLHLLESKATIFPISPNCFAVSSFSDEDGRSRSCVALVRFTAHVAAPFVTTNQSPVVLLSRPTPSTTLQPKQEVHKGDFACMVAVTSEDMAVRLVDAQALRVVATLPPPPNSQVQVLRVMICPEWRLLILWLSSMEIAIFFVPPSTPRMAILHNENKASAAPGSPRSRTHSSRNSQVEPPSPRSPRRSRHRLTATGGGARVDPGAGGGTQGSLTPILVRRFGILEVVAHSLDKELMQETFNCMALHHGRPLPREDVKEPSSFSKPVANEQVGPEAWTPDWFLCVGTKLGTMQAFRLKEVLESSPTWARLAQTLPVGAWTPRRRRGEGAKTEDDDVVPTDNMLTPFDDEQRAALNALRVPGQRPYPIDAPSLLLYGRWICHDYQVEVLETCGARLLTIDMRKKLKLWRIRDMQCVFEYRLGEFLCHAPYFEAVAADGDNAPPDQEGPVPELRGVCTGESNGQLRLLVTSAGRAVPSTASHADAVQQIDFIWPHNAFVSIGADCTVKLWSRALTLLRDIAFPQPLTSVGFKQRPDSDSAQGHGDVIVGFAKHAELISVDFWTRDIPKEHLGKAARRSSALEDPMTTTIQKKAGFTNAIAEGSEEIEDHICWLHAEDPLSAKQRLESQKGVGMMGTGFVQKMAMKAIEHKASSNIQDPEKRAKRAEEEEKRAHCSERARLLREEGICSDFRGRPLVNIAELSGAIAAQSSLDASQWSSKEPTVSHERASCLDEGEIADVSHIQPGYYDRFVEPTTVVDCPRAKTIRGQVDMQGIAHVTSVGTDYLRGMIPSSAPEIDQEVDKPEQPEQAKDPKPGDVELTRGKTPDRDRKSVAKARNSMVATSTQKFDRACEPGEEPWRNIRRGRAIPAIENEPKPRMQHTAHDPEKATAMMLTKRQDVAEVPDVPAENFLKNLTTVKTEWLYTQPDSEILEDKQREIERILSLRDTAQTWTRAGRLVMNEEPMPCMSTTLAKHSMFQRPGRRPPETRGEVTERALIARAKKAPTPTPQFALCGDEPWQPKTSNHGILRRPPRDSTLRSDPRSGGVIRSAR